MLDERLEAIRREFIARYGSGEDQGASGLRFFRAPGRVNLLGEHTDYNDGFVLPIAIDRDVSFAARCRRDRTVRLYSLDFKQESVFDLDSIQRSQEAPWSNYIRGMAEALESRGKQLQGLDAVLQGNVPIASGLSSSAAIEVGSGLTFQCLSGFEMGGVDLAVAAQQAENQFIGVRSGIMDQYISRMGVKGHALLVDCRSLEYRSIPLGEASSDRYAFVVGDTGVRRELAGSEYNVRREQCEEAVQRLSSALPGIRALRDVRLSDLEAHASLLSPLTLKRARHVVSENERVMAGVAALENGDVKAFGQRMNQSHDSLRDDYEVSCAELDTIVNAARSVPGVLGSRMTGAGFGGCTVSLVDSNALQDFDSRVTQAYRSAFGRDPALYVCHAVGGAHEVYP